MSSLLLPILSPPGFGIYPLPNLESWPQNIHFLAGSSDKYVDIEKNQMPNLQVVAGADHFFVNELKEVRRFTRDVMQSYLA